MSLYSNFPARRALQIVVDLLAVLAIIAAIVTGAAVRAAMDGLAGLGEQLESTGTGFDGALSDAGDRLGGVPLIGGGIRSPFDAAAEAGQSLAAAGVQQQMAVHTAASVAGMIVTLLPIGLLLVFWVRSRVAFAVGSARARALLDLPDGLDLLALRALVCGSAGELRAAAARPTEAWQAQQRPEITRLAALELRTWGVRPPDGRSQAAPARE
jgi:hypothetical protein